MLCAVTTYTLAPTSLVPVQQCLFLCLLCTGASIHPAGGGHFSHPTHRGLQQPPVQGRTASEHLQEGWGNHCSGGADCQTEEERGNGNTGGILMCCCAFDFFVGSYAFHAFALIDL